MKIRFFFALGIKMQFFLKCASLFNGIHKNIASAFNLRPPIGQIHLFCLSRWIGCIFLGVNNACSNPVFGFISRARARGVTSAEERASLNEDLWIFDGANLLSFFWPFSLFRNSLRMPNTLERCHDLRAITSRRLIAFCILQLVHHVRHNWYSNNSRQQVTINRKLCTCKNR